MRELLEDVAELNRLEYREYLQYSQESVWKGNITLTGIKRVIHSIWNEGENEDGEDLTSHLEPKSFEFHRSLVEKYSKEKMPILFIEGVKYE